LVPAGVNTGSNVQSHSYVYDVLGNVTQRLDGATGRDERFSFADGSDGYDGLNRLRVQRVIGGATVTVAMTHSATSPASPTSAATPTAKTPVLMP
jgi:hypothetical protein